MKPYYFYCPLGEKKLCGNDYKDLPLLVFAIICGPLDNSYLATEAMDDLTGDQQLL